MERQVSKAEVEALGETRKLAPKITDFIGRPGFAHRREQRADGTWEDVVSWVPNDNGKPTRAAKEVEEALRPFGKADTARFCASQERVEKALLRDADGGTRFVPVQLAESAAKRNGWVHKWRAGGSRVRAGLEGDMLYRWGPNGWEPTGYRQVGVNAEPASRRAIQRDPSGEPWVWRKGKWRKVEEG